MANKIIRGLQDLRTLSGRDDKAASVYKGYMKLSCLEMEKLRRNKERKSAMQRVTTIDARFSDIERDKKALLQELGLSCSDAGVSAPAKRDGHKQTPMPDAKSFMPDTKSFKIKY